MPGNKQDNPGNKQDNPGNKQDNPGNKIGYNKKHFYMYI